MKVLVTGASGFLGGPACDELNRRGHEVLALVRRPGSEPSGTTAVAGDLSDSDSLDRALGESQPDAVLHLAAENGAQRNASKVDAANVAGLKSLIAACEKTSKPKFVFASTVVTGDAHGALLTEDSELPVETAYGRSKQEGELLLSHSSLETVIIRPSHVYGAGGWYADEFVKRLRSPGRFAVIGKGDNYWDVVHVDDVATAMADGAEKAQGGSVYHVVDDKPTTFYDFIALTASELGVGRPRRIPAAVARLAGGRDPIAVVTRSARSSNHKIKHELGWQPQYPTAEQGIPAVVADLNDPS